MGTASHRQKPLVTLNCAHRFMLPFLYALSSSVEVTCSYPAAPYLSCPGLYHMHFSVFKSLFPRALGTLWGPKTNCSFLSLLLSVSIPNSFSYKPYRSLSAFVSSRKSTYLIPPSVSLSFSNVAFFQAVLCFRPHSCTVWSLCLISHAAHYIQEPFAICLGFYKVSCNRGILAYFCNCGHLVFFVYSYIRIYISAYSNI